MKLCASLTGPNGQKRSVYLIDEIVLYDHCWHVDAYAPAGNTANNDGGSKYMKSNILVFLLTALIVVDVCHSQSLIRDYGLKIGATSATQDFVWTGYYSVDRRIGVNAGGFIEWFDIPFFTLVTQMEYSEKGSTFNIPPHENPLPDGPFYSRLKYLSVPVLAKFIIPSSAIEPYILMGARIDWLVGYDSVGYFFDAMYHDFRKPVMGATFGGGIRIAKLLPLPLLIEGRYNLDLGYSYDTREIKTNNETFDIWLGVEL